MISTSNVHVLPMDGIEDVETGAMDPGSPALRELARPLRRAVARTRSWLLGAQHPEGYWLGELEGDTILESEFILLLAHVGREDSEIARRAARRLLDQQTSDGGWSLYPDGPLEISASVKAYFALKLTGHDPGSEPMQKARAAILAHGGADAVNSFTRFYLALLGQISYDQCPAVPPEAVLLPRWFPVNLYAVSAWSRTILVPLSIMSACRPVTPIAPERGIRELFLKAPAEWPELRSPGLPERPGPLSWQRFFRLVDRGLKWLERRRITPLRNRALAAAERWMLERFVGSDGLGAIFPPMVWSIVALKCLGHDDEESPQLEYCWEKLAELVIDEDDRVRLEPCKSPVWDTAITLRALADGGAAEHHPAVRQGVRWLLDQQIHTPGDWSQTVRAEPGGWCFEHANPFYPDVDDTVMAMMALSSWSTEDNAADSLPPDLALLSSGGQELGSWNTADDADLAAERTAAIERAERWVRAMQNRDGGWGAFDRDNDREFLCQVPFADHNAMIDPSTPDLTGRVLEALGQLGRRVGDPAVDRAVAYLADSQEADGSWFGRWGVNYIYGSWQVLAGLRAVGVAADDPLIVAGANWLVACQQPLGGWGESPASYAQPHLRGQGPATASQTAWAVLGLLAAGREEHPAVVRGVQFLIDRQNDDGRWDEPEFTGVGFPQVFYLRYHLYPVYFPLMALARWARAIDDRLLEDSLARPAARETLSLR